MTIIDAVTFFQESDLLALRMAELDPVVDLFVVVEGDRTHAGAPRQSAFPEALKRQYSGRVIHHMARLPEGDGLTWTWRREIAQRNAITEVLHRIGCQADDMILISDCDEIPRRQFVTMLHTLPQDGIAVAVQHLHYYTFNHRAAYGWNGTRATQFGNIVALGADGVRYAGPERGGFPRIARAGNAGWHFSYFGGPEYVQRKIESFLHQELNEEQHRDPAVIAARMAAGADVYGRDEQSFTLGWASDLPTAITEQPGRWLDHFWPDYRPHFTVDWTSDAHASHLASLARTTPQDGALLEVGAWEGRSTVALLGAAQGRTTYVIDHWQGNGDEDPRHPTVAHGGDAVFTRFLHNMTAYGLSPTILRDDWRAALPRIDEPIAFAYLDAAHDEASVSAQITALLPRLLPGALLAGDDAYAPGVQQATTAMVPDAQTDGRVWWWRKT